MGGEWELERIKRTREESLGREIRRLKAGPSGLGPYRRIPVIQRIVAAVTTLCDMK